MISHESIKKCISAPFAKLLSPTKKQKHVQEYINLHRGVNMILYDSNPCVTETGVLFLCRNKNNQKLELKFSINVENEPTWNCVLDQFDQLKRPRPNLLCVESYGITTLFKFTDAQEAKTLYETVEVLQGWVKVIHKYDNNGSPTDFQELNMHTLNQKRVLTEVRPNTVRAKPYFNVKHEGKENEEKGKLKQKSIKNSFKTIISAAKRVKQRQNSKNTKFDKEPSKADDDTSPLLF